MSINDRIIAIIGHFENGKKKAFAEKIGVPVTTLQNIVGGRASDPTFNILNRIITAYPEVDITWLMTDKGDITGKPQEKSPPDARECRICDAKDEIIASLKQQIKIQADYIDTLKETGSQNPGEQKRKVG